MNAEGQDRRVSFFKDSNVSVEELKKAPAGTAADDETLYYLIAFVCERTTSVILFLNSVSSSQFGMYLLFPL